MQNLKNDEDVEHEEILIMDEPFISGQTTLEINIMDDVNKKKFIHTMTCSTVNEKVMEINIHS